jgi:hypothetical protein
MSKLKVQIKNQVQMPERKEFDITAFLIDLTFGF